MNKENYIDLATNYLLKFPGDEEKIRIIVRKIMEYSKEKTLTECNLKTSSGD